MNKQPSETIMNITRRSTDDNRGLFVWVFKYIYCMALYIFILLYIPYRPNTECVNHTEEALYIHTTLSPYVNHNIGHTRKAKQICRRATHTLEGVQTIKGGFRRIKCTYRLLLFSSRARAQAEQTQKNTHINTKHSPDEMHTISLDLYIEWKSRSSGAFDGHWINRAIRWRLCINNTVPNIRAILKR